MKLFYNFIPGIPKENFFTKDIFFLHGFLASGTNLKYFAKKFTSEGYNIYLPDLRNHGNSPHSHEMNYQIMADDIYNLIHQKKLKKIILCGHSMGGKISMEFAIKHPNLVEKLIVLDMTPDYRNIEEMAKIVNLLCKIDFKQHNSKEEIKEMLLKCIHNPLLVDFLLKNLVSSPQLHWKCNLNLFYQKINFLSKKIVFNRKLIIKTLFIKGENSNYITQKDNELIYNNFKNVEVATIKNAGHWIHYEQPDSLYKVFLGFIQNS